VSLDPEQAKGLRRRAKSGGVSVATVARQAIKRHLADSTYDDLADLLIAAAERLRDKSE
jgi:hypothetical protein